MPDEQKAPLGAISDKEWARIQWEHPTLRLIIRLVEGSIAEPREMSQESQIMRRELPNLCLRDGVQYR